MSRLLAGAVALALTPLLAAAQAPAAPAASAAAPTAVGSVAMTYGLASGFVLRAAEQMPEAEYGFKPTPEVRSFGQLAGHVADAQAMMCAGALGETAPQLGGEKAATKADIVAALKASMEICTRAYQQPDSAALQPMTLFGMETTRLGTLAMNAAHSYEHYGNMVTYMRLKGMVPPSSQRQ